MNSRNAIAQTFLRVVPFLALLTLVLVAVDGRTVPIDTKTLANGSRVVIDTNTNEILSVDGVQTAEGIAAEIRNNPGGNVAFGGVTLATAAPGAPLPTAASAGSAGTAATPGGTASTGAPGSLAPKIDDTENGDGEGDEDDGDDPTPATAPGDATEPDSASTVSYALGAAIVMLVAAH